MTATTDHAPTITICIPTFRRPQLLADLLRRLAGQELPSEACLELLVVDNDAARSAEPVVTGFGRDTPYVVRYVCEPVRGYARVRNRLIDEASGRWLACIDDDEWPEPGWLQALLRAWTEHRPDVVFGTVLDRYDSPPPAWLRELDAVRRAPMSGTMTAAQVMSGNYFCEKALFSRFNVRYSEAFNGGGEDSDLFLRLESLGARFIGCPDAIVWHRLPPARVTLRALMARAYRNGRINARTRGGQEARVRLRFFVQATLKALLLMGLIPVALVAGRSRGALFALRWTATLGMASGALETLRRTKH